MLHLLLTVNALLVMAFLLMRMSSREHIADPMAVLLWLGLCFYDPHLLVISAAIATLTLLYHLATEPRRTAHNVS
jgi:hypothetical protein